MKSYVNKYLLLAIVLIVISLTLTYYQIQSHLSTDEEPIQLNGIISAQKWKISSAPSGNIFNSNRVFKQKKSLENEVESDSGSKDEYRLVGVLISGGKKGALFSYHNKTIQLSLGDTFASFGQVKRIENNKVESVTDHGQTYEWVIFPVSASPKKEGNK